MPKFNFQEVITATKCDIVCAENITFSEVITDSRKVIDGSLFIALKGENFDGEDFAIEAIENGAAGVMVSRDCSPEKLPKNRVVLKVNDTLQAYQSLARAWRMKFDIPIVAITGSNGKTTTKDLTAAVLSSLGNVQKTSANFNNEIGVPLTLLAINESHKSAVVEIGMRGLHQIEELSKIVRPTIGIVTNVGQTHIELLGSIENIARAKAELIESITAGGTVILNADNPYVIAMKSKINSGVKLITFGIDNEADVHAVEVMTNAASTTFTVQYGGVDFDCEIPILGIHNVSNSLAAIAVGLTLGLSFEQIITGLSTLKTTKMRFEIVERRGVHIINDAYNASPASMRMAIQTTSQIAAGRKIAVLGDMLELGHISDKVHRQIGAELVKSNFQVLVTLGKLGRLIAEGAGKAGLEEIFTADTHEQAAQILKKILKKGDTILFKGSRGMRMEKIIELI